jgi:hypothetical protein
MAKKPLGEKGFAPLTPAERSKRWRKRHWVKPSTERTRRWRAKHPKPAQDLRPPDDAAERRAVLQMLEEMLGELAEVLDQEPVAAPFVVGWRMGIEQAMHITGRRMKEVRTLDWSPDISTGTNKQE